MRIELTPAEIMLGAEAGVMRQVENLKIGRKPAYGAGTENDWQLHIEGCLAEMAMAKYLGVYWAGKGKLRHPDVGDMDVRTRSKSHYRLILHKEDPDDRVFWLMCGVNGKYDVVGWIRGRDGKQEQYWSDPAGGRPAYFVPQEHLHQGPVQ